ncbi:hypothetical protein ACHAWF_010450 [Thalassiosira exigua]
MRYTLFSKEGGTILATAESHLYLWRSSDSIVVSDVDGTVTKSDVRGVIDSVVQDRFEYCHEGKSTGLQELNHESSLDRKEGEVRFLYLSARPISLIGQTRKLLGSLSQRCLSKKMHYLPPGPVLCHTGPISSVLYSELVAKVCF